MAHPIDVLAGMVYRLGVGGSRVFPAGWGDRSLVEMLADPASLAAEVEPANVVWGRKEERSGYRLVRGSFTSPAAHLLPSEARAVPVEYIEPASGGGRVVVLMPAWNDHGFEQRRRLAVLLAERGMASLSFEIPLYGQRRVTAERASPIPTVADFGRMGTGAVLEARALIAGVETERTTGVSGFSMGGSLAGLISAADPRSLATAPLASAHAPGPVYLDGVLRHAVDWKALGGRSEAGALRTVLTSASSLAFPARAHHRTAIVLVARGDGFVPFEASQAMADHWGAEMRVIDGGHATALWRHRPLMADVVVEAFDRFESGDGPPA